MLPGPTGESNTLRHHARGVFAVLGRAEAGLAAAVSALLAGNSVVWLGGAEQARQALLHAGLPAAALTLLPEAATAGVLADAMRVVATEGTARNLLVEGLDVGGKTGTAQLGTDPPNSHAWIVGFAGRPGESPSLAVAVIVEAQEGASEQTGGRVAAPIAQAVIRAVFGDPAG